MASLEREQIDLQCMPYQINKKKMSRDLQCHQNMSNTKKYFFVFVLKRFLAPLANSTCFDISLPTLDIYPSRKKNFS